LSFVALISCAIEKLSARRFSEYLSLGQVPDATPEGEPFTNPAGDEVAMLRDPWGLAIQLIHRADPMIG